MSSSSSKLLKTSLLIQEPPLQVLPSLAKEIGLNNAIVLQQLHWLLENKNIGVMRDGYKWVFNTHEEWQEKNFTWWSIKTIQRIFTDLEKQGLVVIEQLDKNDWNMRNFYRIDYEAFESVDRDNLSSSKRTTRADIKGTHSPDDNNSNTESPSAENDIDKNATAEYLKSLEHRAETIAKYFRLSVLKTDNEDAPIAPLMKQIIVNCAKTYEDESWYEPAFTMMVKNCQSPTFTYVETILENWQKYGFGKLPPEFEKKNGNGKKNGKTGKEAAGILRGEIT